MFSVISRGVARYFDARGEQSQWPPLSEITDFNKKIALFIELYFICLDNLKLV
jgi:hypothetical protein